MRDDRCGNTDWCKAGCELSRGHDGVHRNGSIWWIVRYDCPPPSVAPEALRVPLDA